MFAASGCAMVRSALQATGAGVDSVLQSLKLPEVCVHNCSFAAWGGMLMSTRRPGNGWPLARDVLLAIPFEPIFLPLLLNIRAMDMPLCSITLQPRMLSCILVFLFVAVLPENTTTTVSFGEKYMPQAAQMSPFEALILAHKLTHFLQGRIVCQGVGILMDNTTVPGSSFLKRRQQTRNIAVIAPANSTKQCNQFFLCWVREQVRVGMQIMDAERDHWFAALRSLVDQLSISFSL